MKRIISTIMTLSAFALLLASCGKEPIGGAGNAPAIKLTVDGVADTKARIITDKNKHTETIFDYIESNGFNISAYVTDTWKRDDVGDSPDIPAGIFVDPDYYEGPYDESTYPDDGNKLKDVLVSYNSSREDPWRITGNDGTGYADHKFSWVNGVAMNFFAYAPVTGMKGTRTINKGDTSVDANYPFDYSAKVVDDDVSSANCDDIIFAYAQHTATFETSPDDSRYGKLINGSTDKFNINFHHALAQIRFCVDPADFSDIQLVYVKLVGPASTSGTPGYMGIATSGSCTFAGATDTFSWSSLANHHSYSQTFNGTSGVSFASGVPDSKWVASKYGTNPEKDLYTCVGDVLLVIPQTLANCGVEVGIQEGSGPVQQLKGHLPATTSTSTDVSWAAGKYYTYKIGTAGERDNLSLSMTLVDWAEREHYIPID